MNPESDIDLLLTVVDRFQIEHLGLVLAPDFSVPDGRWCEQTHPVIVEVPDGRRFETHARLGLSHFNIRDPEVSMDRRWRVTVTLPEACKEQIPIGSRVLAEASLVATLHPKTKA
jgi:hypothetical protein